MSLYNDIEVKISESVESFSKKLTKSEAIIYKYIVENLASIITLERGAIVFTDAFITDELNQFYEIVSQALREANYVGYVDELISNTNGLNSINNSIHKSINVISKATDKITRSQLALIEQIKYSLRGDGLRSGFLAPLGDALVNSAANGYGYEMLLQQIESQLLSSGEGSLLRWASSAAQEAMYGYTRGVNQAIKVEYDLDGHLYAGGLIKTSRPFCIEATNRERFDDSTLDMMINKYSNNGLLYGKFTTVENFEANCGGFNCRHVDYPVRLD